MNLDRHIRRLNNLLRVELGSVTSIRYSWQHSSTLIRHYYKSNPDGSPMYEHKVVGNGYLLTAQRVMATRLLHPELPDNWILCAWTDDYDELGGGHAPLTFQKIVRGEAFPDMVCLGVGEVPTLEATQEVCRLLRDHHSRTLLEHRNEHDYREHRRLRYELDPTYKPAPSRLDQLVQRQRSQSPDARITGHSTGSLRFEGTQFDDLKDKIKEDLGVSTEPGKLREKSFAPVSGD
jgi:hypothetical protein